MSKPPTEYNDMDRIEMLRNVRKLIRGRWDQGANAYDEEDNIVPPLSPTAVKFCLRGACIRVLNPPWSKLSTDLHVETSPISRMIASAFGYNLNSSLVEWNDEEGRTVGDVIAFIDARIKTLKLEKRDAKLSAIRQSQD
jgi:hypothetical protein